jgi:NADPH:quinone reductase-like Zn-dependent oxidoreductase
MRAVHLTAPPSIDSLKLVDLPDPEPGPGEVLVRVGAVSLNFRDLMVVRGAYAGGNFPMPLIPCSDAAGTVVAVGAGVTRLKPGDRVAPNFFPRWIDGPVSAAAQAMTLGVGGSGTLAEFLVLDEAAFVTIPDHLSLTEAACLPCAGVTAWNALMGRAPIHPGDTVVVQGTGGVALFALALANAAGARVIALTSTDAKCSRLEALGANATVNYTAQPDWDKAVIDLTGGIGADLIIDVVGPTTLPKSLAAARVGGKVAVIGAMGGAGTIDPMLISRKSLNVRGIYVGPRVLFEAMNAFVTEKQLRPVVSQVLPLAEAPAAFNLLAERRHFGKVVIEVGG